MPLKITSRRVISQVTPTPQQSAGVDLGGVVGGAIQTVGQTVSQLGGIAAQKEQQQRATAKETERLRKAAEKEQEVQDRADAADALTLYKGALAGNDGKLKSREQRLAKGITVEHDTFNKDLTMKISSTLNNPRVQTFFNEDASLHNITARDSVKTYERAQGKKANESAYTANADQSVKLGVTPYEPENVINSLEILVDNEDNINDQAASMQLLKGWGKDETKIWNDERVSKMYVDTISLWSTRNSKAASALLDAKKDKIDPAVLDDLTKKLETEGTAQAGQDAADAIQSQTDDYATQRATAKKIKDAGERKVAIQIIEDDNRANIAQEKEVNRQTDIQLFNGIKATFDSGDLKSQSRGRNLANRASSPAMAASLRAYNNGLYKEDVVVSEPGFISNVLKNIQADVYKSLDHLRMETDGKLSPEDQDRAENYFEGGGIRGDVTYSRMAQAFKFNSDLIPEENQLVFMSAWRFVESKINALPIGTTKVDDADLIKWMGQAVLKEADDGNIFSPDIPGLTLSQKAELGTLADFDVEMTDEDVERTRALMIDGNEKRVAEGKAQYPLNEKNIKKAFLNTKGVSIPKPAPIIPFSAPPTVPVAPLSIRPLSPEPFKFESALESFEAFKASKSEEELTVRTDESLKREYDLLIGGKVSKARATQKGEPFTLEELSEEVAKLREGPEPIVAPGGGEAVSIEQFMANAKISRNEALNALADQGALGDVPLDDPAEESLRKISNKGTKVTIETIRELLKAQEEEAE